MASVCLVLGWMVTSALGPSDNLESYPVDDLHDPASAGTMSGPSEFKHPSEVKRPGIIGDEPEDKNDTLMVEDWQAQHKEPSVSGALAELHHAVSGKIHSWNPYSLKSSHRKASLLANKTNGTISSKKLNSTYITGESVLDGIAEEHRLGARIRIGKCTILFHGNDFWERCIRTHEQHDRQHGYRLHVLRQELLDDVWSKPSFILSLILRELAKPWNERLQWLFWVDSDTVILNPYIPIETFLPPPGTEFDDVYLMYSADWNGLNNGVFPVRVNQWSAELFAAIVAFRTFKPDEGLQFRDQSVMNTLLQDPKFAKHVVQAPQRWFNAYQGEHNETLQPFQIRRGDLLVHFAGVGDRETRMQYWLERAEQHLDDWEVPVKATSYPQEARDFWSDQRELRKVKKADLEKTREDASKLLTTTDQHMNEYGDRLDDEKKIRITEQWEKLKKVVDEERTKDDKAKIEEAVKSLNEAASPLASAITEANKLLLQSAHEAIFAGEKDLMEGGYNLGKTTPELEQVSSTVKNLKNLVMAPEEFWNRQDITSATNAVTEARAKFLEKTAAEIAAQKEAVAAQVAAAKALAEAKKAAQLEAGEAIELPEALPSEYPLEIAYGLPMASSTADPVQVATTMDKAATSSTTAEVATGETNLASVIDAN